MTTNGGISSNTLLTPPQSVPGLSFVENLEECPGQEPQPFSHLLILPSASNQLLLHLDSLDLPPGHGWPDEVTTISLGLPALHTPLVLLLWSLHCIIFAPLPHSILSALLGRPSPQSA